ncbi:MAG: carbamoyltransferase [Planctomycetes bacterium]|nr:carbamoyltransferase [Planctomycetota bacterium]
MKILGLGSPFLHDPAAALVVDGEIIAAVEEERFSRNKHATRELPIGAARYCLEMAGIEADAIDIVAFPWSPDSYRRDLPSYLRRTWQTRPSRAWKAIRNRHHELRFRRRNVEATFAKLGASRTPRIEWVDHHLAHVASSYYLSGWRNAALLSVDGSGEFTTTFLGVGRDGAIEELQRIYNPDSLGFFYSTITEFLGFRRDDGEFKTMGMSAYGDPSKIDVDWLIEKTRDGDRAAFRIHDDHVWCTRRERWTPEKMFGPELVKRWGEPRSGDGLTEPYMHIAASAQKALEDIVLSFCDTTLARALDECEGRLCIAGGCALNVRMNRKLLEHPRVREIWVQPAAHDAGTPLGAAVEIARRVGDDVAPMTHAYLGPEYDDERIGAALDRFAIPHTHHPNGGIIDAVTDLLVDGEVVAWFQGRMEYGPRALGNRSILGNPFHPGTSDRINGEIKFREKWRPFCPSMASEEAAEILATDHPSPYMTFSFIVNPDWRDRIPEAVHVDGSARPQIVTEQLNPRFYRLIRRFADKTGVPVLINTSLNRRGEPMVCSPEDALKTFYGSGLRFLALGDRLIAKDARRLDPRD